MYKQLLSAAAVVLTFTAFYPYIRSIQRGKTKPHVFSWVIWGLTTFTVFLAQLAGHGGIGALPIGVSGFVTVYIAVLAYRKRSDSSITKMDWLFLTSAVSALPFWALTANPLWAVVTLTSVDMLGFGPTLRAAFHRPHSENIEFFSLFVIRNVLVIVALERYSLTTVLFPAATAFGCLVLIAMVMYRRHSAAGTNKPRLEANVHKL